MLLPLAFIQHNSGFACSTVFYSSVGVFLLTTVVQYSVWHANYFQAITFMWRYNPYTQTVEVLNNSDKILDMAKVTSTFSTLRLNQVLFILNTFCIENAFTINSFLVRFSLNPCVTPRIRIQYFNKQGCCCWSASLYCRSGYGSSFSF